MTSPSDGSVERALLGSVLTDNSLWPETESLSSSDFALEKHRHVYETMAAMLDQGESVDLVTLIARMGDKATGEEAYIGAMLDGCVPEHAVEYVRKIRRAAHSRRIKRQIETLSHTEENQLPDRLRELQDLVEFSPDTDDWKSLFHSYDEVINAPPVKFAIEGFLQQDGITMIGGLAGHGKTLCMLAIVRALLEGGKLFHHFPVVGRSERVIYLIPEAGLSPFSTRLKMFRLCDHIRDGRLFCQTLSSSKPLALTNPKLLAAAKGADVFLDTAIRFMVGDENSAAEQKQFAETLFALQRAGARTIIGAHHSPKGFERATVMTLENILRGSGDIGAMLATCWGLSQIDAASNRIFIQNVKPREFQACEPFIIQGRPTLDQTGYFELTAPPGFAGSLSDNKPQAGRPDSAGKDEKIAIARQMRDEGKSYGEIQQQLNINKGTLHRWLTVA
jgi:hypothetical protein